MRQNGIQAGITLAGLSGALERRGDLVARNARCNDHAGRDAQALFRQIDGLDWLGAAQLVDGKRMPIHTANEKAPKVKPAGIPQKSKRFHVCVYGQHSLDGGERRHLRECIRQRGDRL